MAAGRERILEEAGTAKMTLKGSIVAAADGDALAARRAQELGALLLSSRSAG